MRLVVVDDEPIVLAGIASILADHRDAFEIVAQCENGFDALTVIEREKPDIVITDIRMGGMSGLELAEKIREMDEQIVIILLSGYSDFSFAQKALTLGVFEYLVKPTRYGDIVGCLARAAESRRKLIYARDQQSKREKADQEAGKEDLHAKFFQEVLRGQIREQQIAENARALHLTQDAFVVMNFVFDLLGAAPFDGGSDSFAMGIALHDVIHESLAACGKMHRIMQNIDSVVVVLMMQTADEDAMKKVLRGCEQCVSSAFKTLHARLFIGLSRVKSDFLSLQDGFRESVSAAKLAEKSNATVKLFGQEEDTVYSPQIQKALEYIGQHYTENISLKTVSTEVFLNAWYFSELFKKEVGKSFTDYMLNLRIAKAKVLIQDKRLPLYEISYMVGINGPTYFSQVFKRMTGFTPKEYRKISDLR